MQCPDWEQQALPQEMLCLPSQHPLLPPSFCTLNEGPRGRLVSYQPSQLKGSQGDLSPVEVLMPRGVLHIQDSSLHIAELAEVLVEGLLDLQQAPGHLGPTLAKEAGQRGLLAVFPARKVLLALADLLGRHKIPNPNVPLHTDISLPSRGRL